MNVWVVRAGTRNYPWYEDAGAKTCSGREPESVCIIKVLNLLAVPDKTRETGD